MERIQKEIVEPQIAAAAAEAAKNAAPAEEEKAEGVAFLPEIKIDDFGKIDLRVGKIVSCEKLKNPVNCSSSRLRTVQAPVRFFRALPSGTLRKI